MPIFEKIFKMLRPYADASGSRARPHRHRRVLGRQIQGVGVRPHQGRQHVDAHRRAQRSSGHGNGSLQEGCTLAHAEQGQCVVFP